MSSDERHPAESTPATPLQFAIAQPVSGPQKSLRQYDDEPIEEDVGIPTQRPTSFRSVETLGQDASIPQRGECPRPEYLPEERPETTASQRAFRNPVVAACLILCVTAFSVIILSEAVQFIQALQATPVALQVVAYLCITVLATASMWSLVRLAIAYRSLTTSPQVRLDRIRDARSRAITRDQIERQLDAGYEALHAIVSQYPIDDPRQLALLRKAKLGEDELKTFQSNIVFLIAKENAGKTKWIEDCDRLFIKTIDGCAKQCVSDYARGVGVKTALSPTGLIDALIVTINAVYMIEELCRLYFVRTSRWNSVLLTAQVVFATFISSRLEDQIDQATDTLLDDVTSNIPKMAEEMFAKITFGLLKRTAEGTANMVLFYRLGSAAMKMLRPVRA